jgi:hypothetical protein
VEVVYGDTSDGALLDLALTGVHTVFAMDAPAFGPDRFDREVQMGKMMADVALKKGVAYYIYSTLPSVRDMSG